MSESVDFSKVTQVFDVYYINCSSRYISFTMNWGIITISPCGALFKTNCHEETVKKPDGTLVTESVYTPTEEARQLLTTIRDYQSENNISTLYIMGDSFAAKAFPHKVFCPVYENH